ncbi:ABC transporter permease [Novosphingobium sp. KCTC 2891]|uniref:ABC transporter permease n=1 Tax=Novosphingobium sp. KCTC 2891 TaxID=2989730 RepID=UPI002221F09B|nr:ABC transporter permease [Novosphingobium sp. KCTC 2891]MCW1382128.1 ABC transporter permease [Novosphingobium sp. KCTC 2891]
MLAEKLRAALVIARRDFVAVIFSKTFIFFLLGPVFPIVVGGMAGNIGAQVQRDLDNPVVGVALPAHEGDRMVRARDAMADRMAGPVPEFVVLERLRAGESYDARAALARGGGIAAVVTGTLDAPVLTGTPERLGSWRGMVSTFAARAQSASPGGFPDVAVDSVATSVAQERNGQVLTAQAAQVLLFLLVMLLAGMVLSNLVEEKGNKIIEVLAAAIPMDALFLGKLFAMLAVSLVGIAVWGMGYGVVVLLGAKAVPVLAAPAVGWPAFLILGFLYFAMAYLLLGSLFLSIGGMASTVREVQTLSMPVTMTQLMVFFFASYALARPGTWIETASLVFPVSSPFAMLARAAQAPELWPHAVALVWQAGWVLLIVRLGAQLFRRTVMKSGAAGGRARRGWLAALLRRRTA